MGKTNNNRQVTTSPSSGPSRVVNLSRLRGSIPKINLDQHAALNDGRRKFTAEWGTLEALLADPLWEDVFPQADQAAEFTTRLDKVLDPELSAAEVSAIVQALGPNLDYQQLVRKTARKRLEGLRYLLAYPTPGIREFPLHFKKPIIETFTSLITNLQYNQQPSPAIAEQITNRLENIDFEIHELRNKDPQSGQSSLALQQATLVANIYHFLAATDGPYSQYDNDHGPLADLFALKVVQKGLLDPNSSRPEQSAQEISAAWYQTEYQGLLASLNGGEEK
jgi:hypothetical protein